MNRALMTTCAVACILVLAGAARVHGDDLILFSFEKDEAEKAASTFSGKNAFQELEGGVLRLKPPQVAQNPAANAGIVPMEIVKDEATHGEYALKVPNSDYMKQYRAHYLFYLPDRRFEKLAVDPRVNLRMPELFNTCHWYAGVFPADWSAYDLLRVDVKVVHDRPVTLILEIEDDMVEPPVSLAYAGVKPGDWVTLELDLRKAVEERKLDLAKMSNIFLRFDSRDDLMEFGGPGASKVGSPILQNLAVYVDHIRLCTNGTASAHPAIQGVRSAYTVTLPRAYAADLMFTGYSRGGTEVRPAAEPMATPAEWTPSKENVSLSEPVSIDILPLLVKGFDEKNAGKLATKDNLHNFLILKSVSAVDTRAMLVAFAAPGLGSSLVLDKPHALKFGPLGAVVTADGGATWGGFDGPGETPTWLHKGRKEWQGTVFDANGAVMGLHDDGCLTFRTAYEDYPGDRIFFWRTVFTGTGWARSPEIFVSGDIRWCAHAAQSIVQLPSGRIWALWGGRGRHGAFDAWIRYSDDQGVTWQGWRGPGFVSPAPMWGSLVPYGDYVAIVSGDDRQWKDAGKWTVFDGEAWSTPADVPMKAVVLAVSCGRDIYAVSDDGALYACDGTEWKSLALPGREDFSRFYERRKQSPGVVETTTQQCFSVCGDTALFVEVDKTGTQLLCWRKVKGGAWAGPQTLVTEETPVADVVMSRYGLPGFAPLAYTCWAGDEKKVLAEGRSNNANVRELKPWIKVLNVPGGSQ